MNPCPLDDISDKDNLKETKRKGFLRLDSLSELKDCIGSLLGDELNFFSSMKTKKEIGSYIMVACKEPTNENRAVRFFEFIWNEYK